MANFRIEIPITPSDCVQLYTLEVRQTGTLVWNTIPNTIQPSGGIQFVVAGGAYDYRLTKTCCNGSRSASVVGTFNAV